MIKHVPPGGGVGLGRVFCIDLSLSFAAGRIAVRSSPTLSLRALNPTLSYPLSSSSTSSSSSLCPLLCSSRPLGHLPSHQTEGGGSSSLGLPLSLSSIWSVTTSVSQEVKHINCGSEL
jgi:hypothetical protein